MFPESFVNNLRKFYGEKKAEAILTGLKDEPRVSVRINPYKITLEELRDHFDFITGENVEWCDDAFYLTSRPNFTLDPLFHSGAYYVQEASSMYVGQLFDRIGNSAPIRILDLCAAPGGKTTHLLSKLSADDILVANEVISSRATILAENCAKWGLPNVIVTNNDPADFSELNNYFDLIVVDAPCSGEGMFRKDEGAIEQWSEDNVALCASRQKRILSDIWSSLKPGGHLMYSTCTFNDYENSDNVDWICNSLGGELKEKRQFLPGIDPGEGFFCSLIKKSGESGTFTIPKLKTKPSYAKVTTTIIQDGFELISKGDLIKAYPKNLLNEMLYVESKLRTIHSGIAISTQKGKDLIPEADLALSTILNKESFTNVELTKEKALLFLAKESLTFKDQPNGYLLLTFEKRPLGFVKNLGNRSNNLHPASRRIRKLTSNQ